MAAFTFGVDSFIWSENFTEKDLWIIEKAKSLGFTTIDLAVAHPEKFPTEKVKAEKERVGINMVTTTTLGGWLHILLVIAVIFLLIRVIRGQPV